MIDIETRIENMKQRLKTFKQFHEEITENKDDYVYDLDYKRSKGQVLALLHGKHSEEYTRLAYKIEEIQKLEDEIKLLKKDIKGEIKEKIFSLFDAEDKIYTRVVETVSVIFTVSKDPQPTSTVSYKKVLDEFTKHLTPDLIDVLEKLKLKFTAVRQREPSLKFKRKDEFLDTDLIQLRSEIRNFYNFIINVWGPEYDLKLERVKEAINYDKSNV